MSVIEILKGIEGIKIDLQKGNLTKATAKREDLAELSRKLVQEHGLVLSLLFGSDKRQENGTFGVHVVFAADKTHEHLLLSVSVPENDPQYPSVTALVMAAHWYERYLQDMFGIVPTGHPDPRRLVHHENVPQNVFPLRKDFAWNSKMAKANEPYPMQHVEGEGVYEIPVGPIHAGIIEPGHFRFNVAGERIMTLEGKLFFTHKGVEKILEGKTLAEGLPFVERLSGDMAASNALAYVQAAEEIASCQVPQRALLQRSLMCELERLTMHIHDLANIGGMGTGYSFIAANGFRIKERLVRLSEELSGNRFWRGHIVLGGVAKKLSKEQLKKIVQVAKEAGEEMLEIVETALASEGFLDRLQTTGVLPFEAAKAFGALGLPARASGVDRDVRRDFPYAAYIQHPIKIEVRKSGDVCARYLMRVEEIKASLDFIARIVEKMPEGEIQTVCTVQDGFALGAVESWRGEILCALSVKKGVISRCFVRDPSFCNWPLFGIIGPGNIVPDFPLCNKSLNLSYSGTDM